MEKFFSFLLTLDNSSVCFCECGGVCIGREVCTLNSIAEPPSYILNINSITVAYKCK
jgi:hypothetical protein